MKFKTLLGVVILLANSCASPELQLKTIDLGVVDTKAVKSFDWYEEDQIAFYSIVDGKITYKDVSTIHEPNGGSCKVHVNVDVNATQYFAVYPKDALNCQVGDMLNDEALNVVYTGNYHTTSIMTTYVPLKTKFINFHQRLALLLLPNSGDITIWSSLPYSATVEYSPEYYIPITYKNEQVKIQLNGKLASFRAEPGVIYR